MTEKMELTFDVQKIAIFVLVIIFNSLPRVAGLILGNTTVKSCNASSQNIDFVVDLQNGTIPSGSEIWYYESTVIATRPGGIFTPQGNYTSRLHTYSTYGLTLDNITAADKGTYLFVFLYYTPTPQGSKTATSTLTVNVAPDDSCIPSYKKSGDLAICELDPAANCGSPRLEPMWTHTYGNTFTVTNAGTYTCCANGSILMDCYRGSSSFCKTFQVGATTTTSMATTTTTMATTTTTMATTTTTMTTTLNITLTPSNTQTFSTMTSSNTQTVSTQNSSVTTSSSSDTQTFPVIPVVIGVAVFVLLIIIIIICRCCYLSRHKKEIRRKQQHESELEVTKNSAIPDDGTPIPAYQLHQF